MTYATQQDMVDRFGEDDLIALTDRADPPLGAIDATVLQRAQEDAAATMNAYVSARYALPLPTTPVVLKRCECELAYVQLLGSRVPDEWAKKAERWMAFLRDVSKGLVSLGPDQSNNVPATAGAVFVDSEPAVFDRTTLADY